MTRGDASDRGQTDGTPLFQGRGLRVEYPGVIAVAGVDFDLTQGEVHALMGENGAGKSSLLKVLGGLQPPSAGCVLLRGVEHRLASIAHANASGISTVFQEIDLVPTMSVAENICLGREPRRGKTFLLDHAAMRLRARRALDRLGLMLDVSTRLQEHPIATQQLVAIARALDVQACVLILDEPTSSLDRGEVERLFVVLRTLREQGLGIIFVSHFLEQVYAIADRITVLRNGRKVGTWAAKTLARTDLIHAMTGRTMHPTSPSGVASRAIAAQESPTPPRLVVEALAKERVLGPTSLEVQASEAMGVAGLLGSGRSELLHLLFGAVSPVAGVIRVDGATLHGGSIREAIAAGLALVPEDRKQQGLFLELSVRENILLALQARQGMLRPIARAEAQRLVDHFIAMLDIRTPSPESSVGSLSGGNQQKVLLARWLATAPRVLLLDEPARGVDVGARSQIESLIESLRSQGLALVVVSAEFDELVRTCSAVTVMRDRAHVATLREAPLTEAAMLKAIAGDERKVFA